MAKLLALDVALMLPPDVRDRAVTLSEQLGATESDRLVLDADHHPHVTLTQQFVDLNELDRVLDTLDEALRGTAPLTLHVAGGARTGHSIWMAIERTAPVVDLHWKLMDALHAFERPDGGANAFYGKDARIGDVRWVSGYRLKSSLAAFAPHVTLGHGATVPAIEPFTFSAETVAACHLGRFCTCRASLRSWDLRAR